MDDDLGTLQGRLDQAQRRLDFSRHVQILFVRSGPAGRSPAARRSALPPRSISWLVSRMMLARSISGASSPSIGIRRLAALVGQVQHMKVQSHGIQRIADFVGNSRHQLTEFREAAHSAPS